MYLHPASIKVIGESRVFLLYRNLISHTNIFERFYGEIDKARIIYDMLRSIFGTNYHYWLQYGCLELEAGQLDLAEKLSSAGKRSFRR